MLQFPNWYKIVTALVFITGLLFALPNALPGWVVAKMPSWLPHDSVALGLDLQGGSHVLFEVGIDEVYKTKIVNLTADIRVRLRKAQIGYKGLLAGADSVSLTIMDPARYDQAKGIITDLNPFVGGSLLSVGQRAYEMTEPGNGGIALKMTDAYKTATQESTMGESLEVVRRRIDKLGTREPTITREGQTRIVVEVPGLSDPSQLIRNLGKTGKMTFQLVDETADPQMAQRGVVPIGDELLPQAKEKNGVQLPSLVVERRVMVNGDRLKSASPGFDPETNQPDIDFSFDTVGAKEFGDATRTNI